MRSTRCVDFADAHPEHGVYGGRTLRPDGSLDPSLVLGRADPLVADCASRCGLSTAFRRSPCSTPSRSARWQRDTVREVPIITGCLLLARSRRLGAPRRDGRAVLPLRRGRRVLARAPEARLAPGDRAGCGDRARRRRIDGLERPQDGDGHGRQGDLPLRRSGPRRWRVSASCCCRRGSGVRGPPGGRHPIAQAHLARRLGRCAERGARGYPHAERALFGRTPPPASVRPSAAPSARRCRPSPRSARSTRTRTTRASTARCSGRGVRVRDLNYCALASSAGPTSCTCTGPTSRSSPGHRRGGSTSRASLLFYGTLALARLRGTVVVWTVHNVAAHEERSSPRLRSVVPRTGCSCATSTGSSRSPKADSTPRAPRTPSCAAMPACRHAARALSRRYDFSVARDEARERLGLPADATVVAHGRQVRDYKNVPAPRAHLPASRRRRCGARWSRASRRRRRSPTEIRDAAGDDPRVVRRSAPSSRRRARRTWLAAADLVVLPYRRSRTRDRRSSRCRPNRPVLVPDLGAHARAAGRRGRRVGPPVRRDLDADDLAGAIDWARAPRAPTADLSALDWDAHRRATRSRRSDQIRSGRRAARHLRNTMPIGEAAMIREPKLTRHRGRSRGGRRRGRRDALAGDRRADRDAEPDAAGGHVRRRVRLGTASSEQLVAALGLAPNEALHDRAQRGHRRS